MPTRTPVATVNLATLYDEPEMPWSRAVEALGSGSLGPESAAWLGTVGPDGRPHVAGIGVAVYDGDLYFSSGPKAYKSKNLAREPRAAIGVRLNGLDLSLEGRVEKVTDRDTVATIAALYAEGGWPATVAEDVPALSAPYSAQSAGPGPWDLYRFTIEKAVGVALTEPHCASRWVFAD